MAETLDEKVVNDVLELRRSLDISPKGGGFEFAQKIRNYLTGIKSHVDLSVELDGKGDKSKVREFETAINQLAGAGDSLAGFISHKEYEDVGELYEKDWEAATMTVLDYIKRVEEKYNLVGLDENHASRKQLSNLKQYVSLAGRVLEVTESYQEGEETKYRFKGAVSEAKPAEATAEAHDGQAATGTKRALVADDEPAIRGVLESLMTRVLGYEVKTYDNGQDALDAVKGGEKFDLVITDCVMPKLNGIGLTQALRNEVEYKGPIIAVTGQSESKYETDFLEAGANAFLMKPFSVDEVKATIEKVTGKPVQVDPKYRKPTD